MSRRTPHSGIFNGCNSDKEYAYMKNGKGTMAATDTKEVKTKAQKYLDLKARLAQYEAEAEGEALEELNAPLAVLEQLGKPHVVISKQTYDDLVAAAKALGNAPRGSKSAPGKAKAAGTTSGPSGNYNGSKRCEICNIVSHDGRAHRTHKEPFTQQELGERGLLPPAA
jgi:hypothetical protein